MSAAERGKSSTATGAHESREPEEIREDIRQTREELGDTVAAMADKTDSATEGVQRARRLAKENPVPLAYVGVFVAGVVVGRLLTR